MQEIINAEFERLEFSNAWRKYIQFLLNNFQSGQQGLNDEIIDPGIEILEALRTFQPIDESALRLTLLSRAIARSDSLRIRARCAHAFWDPMAESLTEFQRRYDANTIVHYVESTHRHPAPDIVEYLIRDNLRNASDN